MSSADAEPETGTGLAYGGARGGTYGGDHGGTYGSLGELGAGWRVDLLTRDGATSPPQRRVLGEDRLLSVDLNNEHTAISDVEIEIPPISGLDPDDHLKGRINLWRNGELHLVAIIDDYKGGDNSKLTFTARGEAGRSLTEGELEGRFAAIRHADALRELWKRAGVEATVHDPPAERLSNETIQIARGAGDFESICLARVRDEQGQYAEEQPSDRAGDSPFLATDPLELFRTPYVQGIRPLPTNTILEAEHADQLDGGASRRDSENGSNDGKVLLNTKNSLVQHQFQTAYEIPVGECRVALRGWRPSDSNAILAVKIDGTLVEYVPIERALSDSYGWYHCDPLDDSIDAGSHKLRVEIYDTAGPFHFDVASIYDARYTYSFDNTLDANNALSGPQLYPDQVRVPIQTAAAGFDVDTARVAAGFDGPGGNTTAGVEVASAGVIEEQDVSGENAMIEADIGPERTAPGVRALVSLSRRSDGQRTTTPTRGTEPQALTSLKVSVDGENVPVITDKEISGTPLDTITQLHEDAGMRFAINYGRPSASGKYAESFATGDPTLRRDPAVEVGGDGWTVTEKDREAGIGDYRNRVIVVGGFTGYGGRYRGRAEDQSEIDEFGLEQIRIPDDSQESTGDCIAKARTLLEEHLDADKVGGSLSVVPDHLPKVGRPYRVREFQGEGVVGGFGNDYGISYGESTADVVWSSIESVSYSESADGISLDIDFERPSGRVAFLDAIGALDSEAPLTTR